MKKSSRKSIILLLIVSGVVALVSIVLYAYGFFSVEKDQTLNEDDQASTTVSVSSSLEDWKRYVVDLPPALKAAFPDMVLGAPSVSKVADLNADGIQEALISTGSGGAYTEDMTLAILHDGKPELAKFKDQDGNIGPLLFSEGASVRHAESIVLDDTARSVYQQSLDMDASGSGLERCEIVAYRWEAQTGIFVFNADESNRAEAVLCPIKAAEARQAGM